MTVTDTALSNPTERFQQGKVRWSWESTSPASDTRCVCGAEMMITFSGWENSSVVKVLATRATCMILETRTCGNAGWVRWLETGSVDQASELDWPCRWALMRWGPSRETRRQPWASILIYDHIGIRMPSHTHVHLNMYAGTPHLYMRKIEKKNKITFCYQLLWPRNDFPTRISLLLLLNPKFIKSNLWSTTNFFFPNKETEVKLEYSKICNMWG